MYIFLSDIQDVPLVSLSLGALSQSLHRPGHYVTASMLKKTIKDTPSGFTDLILAVI